MPTISLKGQHMPASPIRKLVPYAEKAYQANKTVYHLNIGQPDIKSPKIAMDAVTMHSLEILAYTRSEGSEEYRKKIATYYQKNSDTKKIFTSAQHPYTKGLLACRPSLDKNPSRLLTVADFMDEKGNEIFAIYPDNGGRNNVKRCRVGDRLSF